MGRGREEAEKQCSAFGPTTTTTTHPLSLYLHTHTHKNLIREQTHRLSDSHTQTERHRSVEEQSASQSASRTIAPQQQEAPVLVPLTLHCKHVLSSPPHGPHAHTPMQPGKARKSEKERKWPAVVDAARSEEAVQREEQAFTAAIAQSA